MLQVYILVLFAGIPNQNILKPMCPLPQLPIITFFLNILYYINIIFSIGMNTIYNTIYQ